MILPEVIQQLDCTSCNVNLIAIAFVFVELQYYLLNNNNVLVDTKFANVRQLISVNNRQYI